MGKGKSNSKRVSKKIRDVVRFVERQTGYEGQLLGYTKRHIKWRFGDAIISMSITASDYRARRNIAGDVRRANTGETYAQIK
jgi:hypothetical protein